MINRQEIKMQAKEVIRGNTPSTYLVTFIFILINLVVSAIGSAGSVSSMMTSLIAAMSSGEPEAIQPVVGGGVGASLLSFILQIVINIIMLGFYKYIINLSRNDVAVIGDLFSCFPMFLKAFGLIFMVGLFTCLWSLLFVIPGIVAAYRYSMAFYIFLDNPDKGIMQCIRESKEMTNGYKMDLFVLDLSFIGWYILTAIPFVSLYVTPYTRATHVLYYETLRENTPIYTTGFEM